MAWWIWVLGGLVLLVAEVTTPGGFFAIFFGAGAILVGAVKALGWEGPAWAAAILAVAKATAEGIRSVAAAIQADGGFEAVQLRVAEQYLTQFGQLAKTGNSLIIPSNLADVGSIIAAAMNVIQARGAAPGRPAGPAR
jgi:hypothetical protein